MQYQCGSDSMRYFQYDALPLGPREHNVRVSANFLAVIMLAFAVLKIFEETHSKIF